MWSHSGVLSDRKKILLPANNANSANKNVKHHSSYWRYSRAKNLPQMFDPYYRESVSSRRVTPIPSAKSKVNFVASSAM